MTVTPSISSCCFAHFGRIASMKGGSHTAALSDEGRVYMWGRCDSGQLGIGEKWLQESDDEGLLGVSQPHLVDGFDGEKVVQVACGAFHSAAVTEKGNVYMWGIGHSSDLQTPTRIPQFEKTPAL